MNPRIGQLQAYPFERLARLKQNIQVPIDLDPIVLSIGEPKHPTPHLIQEALLSHLHLLGHYPTTKGLSELREAIARWLCQRYAIPENRINPDTQILPVNGTREALFAFAQAVIDPADRPLVVMPNPFYQIYEGAALLAGAEPYYLNCLPENGFLPDIDTVPDSVWQRCQLLYLCSPGNPTGAVIGRDMHDKLLELAERHDFIIASDECYSEIYQNENQPPQGLLQSAYHAGNSALKRCVVFQSLSKRSNAPGLRSGFVAGDTELLGDFYQYRTYHGCAMPLPTQHASIAAWQDEAHVRQNRQLYREKFSAFIERLAPVCEIQKPQGGFFIWLKTPWADTEFTRQLYARQNVTVLPGSYLSRDGQDGINPGLDHVRIALVPALDACIDAADRITHFIHAKP